MIRHSTPSDVPTIHEIINDAAIAYKGLIPEDRWHEPYMPLRELEEEIAAGVDFWVYEGENGDLFGVMGIQPVKDVSLIRHAYVKTGRRRGGIGTVLLKELMQKASTPVLIGTWKAAVWAITFYEKNAKSVMAITSIAWSHMIFSTVNGYTRKALNVRKIRFFTLLFPKSVASFRTFHGLFLFVFWATLP
jgi:N-acetylglutamate synthase-like GNAT family acetyltransferase